MRGRGRRRAAFRAYGLNERDLALVAWLSIGLSAALLKRDVRQSALSVLKLAITPKLLVPCVVRAIGTFWACRLGSSFGLWNQGLAKDTVVWYLSAGLGGFGSAVSAKNSHFIWLFVRRSVALAAVAELFTNGLFVFSLPTELLLQPVLIFVGVLGAVAATKAEYKSVKRLTDGILFTLGLLIVVFVTRRLVEAWDKLDGAQLVRELVLPLWLSSATVAFLFGMSLFSGYEQLFTHLRSQSTTSQIRWFVTLSLVFRLNIRLAAVTSLSHAWRWKLARAESLREAWVLVGTYLREPDSEPV